MQYLALHPGHNDCILPDRLGGFRIVVSLAATHLTYVTTANYSLDRLALLRPSVRPPLTPRSSYRLVRRLKHFQFHRHLPLALHARSRGALRHFVAPRVERTRGHHGRTLTVRIVCSSMFFNASRALSCAAHTRGCIREYRFYFGTPLSWLKMFSIDFSWFPGRIVHIARDLNRRSSMAHFKVY